MKFIHVADIHFDIPFKTLSDRADLGVERRLEQRKAFKKMIDFAQENQVDCIFIAGDLYEQEYVKSTTIEYINSLFKEIPHIKIYITPGNHDPYIKNSYYNTYKFADNVKIFTSKFEKIETENYNVYGYGFDNFEMTNKLQDCNLDKSKINIFISHGDIYNETKYNYMPINILQREGFDYIALGHIHKRDKYYPGSLVSLGFDETGKHGFIYGEIKDKKIENNTSKLGIYGNTIQDAYENTRDEIRNEKCGQIGDEIDNKKDNSKIQSYTPNNAKLQFVQADSRELIYQDFDISKISTAEELIEKLNEIETENNLYEINLTGNRMFDISINLKTIQSNIIKIKDSTKIENNTNLNENDKTLSGFFAKNLNEKLKNKEITEKEYEEIMALGKSVLTK